jgi:hypothetical protein
MSGAERKFAPGRNANMSLMVRGATCNKTVQETQSSQSDVYTYVRLMYEPVSRAEVVVFGVRAVYVG